MLGSIILTTRLMVVDQKSSQEDKQVKGIVDYSQLPPAKPSILQELAAKKQREEEAEKGAL
jgi:hypothetical protein